MEDGFTDKNELNDSLIDAFCRLDENAFRELVTKLVTSMGLEIVQSRFGVKDAELEANIGSGITGADFPSYIIKVERKSDSVTPEEVQDFVSGRKGDDKGMIFISTSGFSDDARLYAKEFDVEIADHMVFVALLKKYDLMDDVLFRRDRKLLETESGRFLPSVDELENIIELGKKAYSAGSLEEALNLYSKALEMKPAYDSAWIMKGIILSELKKYEEALEAFMEALEINIENPRVWYLMGTALYPLGRFKEEIQCYDKALELEPNFISALNNKGATLLELEKYEKAQKTYDEILKIDSSFKHAWNNKGIALKNLKRMEEALECFTNAIKIDSRYYDAWMNRGLIYLKEKRYREAYFCFDAALKIRNDDIQALYQMAKTLEGVGQFTKAIKIYDRIMELDDKFYSAKRRKKKAREKRKKKRNSKLDDDFFVLTEEEAASLNLTPPEEERERILVKKSISDLPEPVETEPSVEEVLSDRTLEEEEISPEERGIILPEKVEFETLEPEEIIPKEVEEIEPPYIPTYEPEPEELPWDLEISPPVSPPGDDESISEQKKDLIEKESELVQMESWLREKYFSVENERKELERLKGELDGKKEDIERERARTQKIADELERKVVNIARAEDDLNISRQNLLEKQSELEKERMELRYQSERMMKDSHGSVEDRIALERDMVKMELREKEIAAANSALKRERENVEKERMALKSDMESTISAKAELTARERSISSREEEMKKRFDQIVNRSGDMAIKEKELEELALELKRTQDNLEKRARALKETEKRLLEKQKLLADTRGKMKGDTETGGVSEPRDVFDDFAEGNVRPIRKKKKRSHAPSKIPDPTSQAQIPQTPTPPSLATTLDFESAEKDLYADELQSLKEMFKMYSLGQMEKVESLVNEAQKKGLDSKMVWNIKGNILRQKKEYEKALECYNNALKRDQNYVVTLVNLMSLNQEMVRYEDALKLCKKIQQMRPYDERFIIQKALLEARLGNMDEAVTTLDNLLVDNDKLEVVWNLKGILLYHMKQDEDALECFDEALKLNENYTPALNNKGVVLNSMGRSEEARELLNRASKTGSNQTVIQNIEFISGEAKEETGEVEPEEPREKESEESVEEVEPPIEKEDIVKKEPEDEIKEPTEGEDVSLEEPTVDEKTSPVLGELEEEETEPKEPEESSVEEKDQKEEKVEDLEKQLESLDIPEFEEDMEEPGDEGEAAELEEPSEDLEEDEDLAPEDKDQDDMGSLTDELESAAGIFSELGNIPDEPEEEDITDIEKGTLDKSEDEGNGEANLYMCPSCGAFVGPSAEKCEKCGYDFSEEELEDEDIELEGEKDQNEIEDHEELQGEEETGEELLELESQEEEESSEYDKKIPLDMGAQGEGGAVEELEREDEDQVIENFTKISGLGKSKAKALYDAGFTSYDSLRKAKTEDIADVKGIGKNLAKTIKDQLKKKKFKDQ